MRFGGDWTLQAIILWQSDWMKNSLPKRSRHGCDLGFPRCPCGGPRGRMGANSWWLGSVEVRLVAGRPPHPKTTSLPWKKNPGPKRKFHQTINFRGGCRDGNGWFTVKKHPGLGEGELGIFSIFRFDLCFLSIYNLDFSEIIGFPFVSYLLGAEVVCGCYNLTKSFVWEIHLQKKSQGVNFGTILLHFCIPQNLPVFFHQKRVWTGPLHGSKWETKQTCLEKTQVNTT